MTQPSAPRAPHRPDNPDRLERPPGRRVRTRRVFRSVGRRRLACRSTGRTGWPGSWSTPIPTSLPPRRVPARPVRPLRTTLRPGRAPSERSRRRAGTRCGALSSFMSARPAAGCSARVCWWYLPSWLSQPPCCPRSTVPSTHSPQRAARTDPSSPRPPPVHRSLSGCRAQAPTCGRTPALPRPVLRSSRASAPRRHRRRRTRDPPLPGRHPPRLHLWRRPALRRRAAATRRCCATSSGATTGRSPLLPPGSGKDSRQKVHSAACARRPARDWCE